LKNLSDRAKGHRIPGITIDGNNFLDVYEANMEAVERTMTINGPTLRECKTYWISDHHGHGIDEQKGC
jgi:pyruvate dehydrogenase E1 component alpha subunit